MRTIAIEEHFASPGFVAGPGQKFIEQMQSSGIRGRQLFERLCDVGENRIAEMNAAGIDMQVLSINYPGVEQLGALDAVSAAREANDFLVEKKNNNPTRLAGLAALACAAPGKAAEELEFRVRQQGFKGAVVNGHIRGRYLDDKFFWPILERAEALNVPIYLHPTIPPEPIIEASYSGFSPNVSFLLAGPAWGWHIETATHLIRMILGGVFDRYPRLQIIVGHLGEGLPFMMPRLNKNLPMEATKLERPIRAYLRENVHYTFGGFNFSATFLNLLQEVGVERIMFSVDHPYGSMVEARAFLEQLPLNVTDKDRVAHGNAEVLLRL